MSMISPYSAQAPQSTVSTAGHQSPDLSLLKTKLPPPLPGSPFPHHDHYSRVAQSAVANASYQPHNEPPTVQPLQSQQSYNDVVELLRRAEHRLQAIAADHPSVATQPESWPRLPEETFIPASPSVVGQSQIPPLTASVAPAQREEDCRASPLSRPSERQQTASAPMNLFRWLVAGFTAKSAGTKTAATPSPQMSLSSETPSQVPSQSFSSSGISNIQYVVTGSCIFIALALMLDFRPLPTSAAPRDFCQQMVRPDTALSRDHLTQILSISERTARSQVQQVIAEPYCRLSPVSIRAGAMAERDAYPLEFDPDTWLVMLYEGEEYAGFDFSFHP